MDIKKTDVFGGIGVFVIQMIANGICYAFEKNNIYLVIGIIVAIIVSSFIVIIISLKRKLKMQKEYFNEQIEYISSQKPDIILIPGYQRGERTDIIEAQNKLLSFRTNAYIARSSFSMGTSEHGGNSMIVSPDGQIIANLKAEVGTISADVEPKWKYMRPAGFGQGLVRNDDFISNGIVGIF